MVSVQLQVAAALHRWLEDCTKLKGGCVDPEPAAEEKNTLLLPEIETRTINLHLEVRC